MAPAHIPVFLSQYARTKNGVIRPAVLLFVGTERHMNRGDPFGVGGSLPLFLMHVTKQNSRRDVCTQKICLHEHRDVAAQAAAKPVFRSLSRHAGGSRAPCSIPWIMSFCSSRRVESDPAFGQSPGTQARIVEFGEKYAEKYVLCRLVVNSG